MFEVLSLFGLIIWLAIIFLPWHPWLTTENLCSKPKNVDAFLDDLTVLIPARNEEATISQCIKGVKRQGKDIRIVVIDDCSSDNTYSICKEILDDRDILLKGEKLPSGWSGKLWALEQGLKYVKTKYVLLLDADILLKPGIVSTALKKMKDEGISFLSLMAWLRMENILERLFMPAFIYFFKLLYPFSLSNKKRVPVAAAAGGFILTKKDLLEKVGGFSSLKNALIDDCTLAKKVKREGAKTFIGLTKDVISLRKYERLSTIWNMVSRTAYSQLKFNPLLLILVTFIMFIAFIVPLAGLFIKGLFLKGLLTLFLMSLSYLPTLFYYGQNPFIAITLPFVAFLYLCMTWSSAINYYLGKGASWKDRSY